MLEVGTVIKWNNFPYPRYSNKNKPRWFICAGFSGYFAQVSEVYLYTTTTQLNHFKKFGIRSSHSYFIFQCNHYTVFDQDCAIDFDEGPYNLAITQLEQKKDDIEVKGKLNEQTLRMIYNKLLSSRFISRKILMDIHDSYNKVGIKNLKKPKPTKKK